MAERGPVVFLHVGAMKTGTTYLQHVLTANAGELAVAGFLFPGGTWGAQVRAVRDILRLGREDPILTAESSGAGAALAAEILSRPDAVSIVSMEFLSFADVRGARRVVRSLPGAEVHVVLTVRDAVRSIPSLWQTAVENGATTTWAQFQRDACAAASITGRLSRAQSVQQVRGAQDVPRMLRVWGAAVGGERLHIITVPPAGTSPRLLWERFERVVELPPKSCLRPPQQANESLGYASTELMRLLNEELGGLPRSDYLPTVKEQLGLRVLAQRRGVESRPTSAAATRERGLAWNLRVRRAVERRGLPVSGTLEDLPVRRGSMPPGKACPPPGADELLEAAATAVDGLHALVRRRVRRLERAGVTVSPCLSARDASVSDVHRWDGFPDPVGAAVTEIAGLSRTAIGLHRLLRDASGPQSAAT